MRLAVHFGAMMPFAADLSNLSRRCKYELTVVAHHFRKLQNLVPAGFIYNEAWNSKSQWQSRNAFGITKSVRLAHYGVGVVVTNVVTHSAVRNQTLGYTATVTNFGSTAATFHLTTVLSSWGGTQNRRQSSVTGGDAIANLPLTCAAGAEATMAISADCSFGFTLNTTMADSKLRLRQNHSDDDDADADGDSQLVVDVCGYVAVKGNQLRSRVCLSHPTKPPSGGVDSQAWQYNETSGRLLHLASGKCLQVGSGPRPGATVELSGCAAPHSASQQWNFVHGDGTLRTGLSSMWKWCLAAPRTNSTLGSQHVATWGSARHQAHYPAVPPSRSVTLQAGASATVAVSGIPWSMGNTSYLLHLPSPHAHALHRHSSFCRLE